MSSTALETNSVLVGPRVERATLDAIALVATLALIATIPIEDSLYFGPFTVSRVVGLAAVCVVGMEAAVTWRVNLDRPVAILLCLYTAWCLASSFWTVAPSATFTFCVTIVQLTAMVVVIRQKITTPARARLAMQALCVGGLVGGVLSLLDSVAAHGGVPRYSIGDPNDFGVSEAIAMLITVYLLSSSSNKRARLIYGLAIALEIVAVARTASRAAAIGAVLGMAIIVSTRRALRPRNMAGLIAGGLAIWFVIIHFTSGAALSRVGGTVSSSGSDGLNNRVNIWHLAFRYWSAHPIAGIGGGAFKSYSAMDGGDKVAHSIFIGTLTELGLIGLILILLIFAVAATRVARLRDRFLARHLVAASAAWMCGALTLTWEVRKMTWLLVALFSSLGVLAAGVRDEARTVNHASVGVAGLDDNP